MKRLFVFLSACVAGAVAVAGPTGLSTDLTARHWEEMTFDGKRPNAYAVCGDDCITVETDGSVSMIGRPVAADLVRTPVLAWEWKVEAPVAATDLTKKGQDDRALALYVTFPYDPDTSTWSESMLRPLVELARGKNTPGRTISYVWSGYGTPGQIVASPYFGEVNVMIVARTAESPVGEWLREQVDVAADYERVFGHRPGRTAHILIGADSDDTQSRNKGFVRDITFQPEPGRRSD
ncbi:MAG: DUF3047 domain-containing protein [Rhodospirillales bacterium]